MRRVERAAATVGWLQVVACTTRPREYAPRLAAVLYYLFTVKVDAAQRIAVDDVVRVVKVVIGKCHQPTLVAQHVVVDHQHGVVWVTLQRWHQLFVAAYVSTIHDDFHA